MDICGECTQNKVDVPYVIKIFFDINDHSCLHYSGASARKARQRSTMGKKNW